MDVSVIIVNWNTRDLLRSCLASLTASGIRGQGSGVRNTTEEADTVSNTDGVPVPLAPDPCTLTEVIVVDNASTDDSAVMVTEEFPEAELIAGTENLGWAKGNNVGAARAKGRYLLLLNPDTEVQPGALGTLTRFMDTHSDAGACAPKLLNGDGSVQPSLRRFPRPLYLVWDVLGLAKLFPKSAWFAAYRMGDFSYDRIAEVDQPMGAALFIRREAWESVGDMDESFPIFFNDVDWCYRAIQAGWKIYFVPEAEIVHHGGGSTIQVKPKMVTESHRSLERFYCKHYRNRLPRPLMAGVMALSRGVERMRIARAKRSPAPPPALKSLPTTGEIEGQQS